MKALVVEDDRVSAMVLAGMVEPFATVQTAENGRIGVEKFKNAHEAGEPFDLVLLDIMMPEMDGHQALSRMRALEAEWGIFGLDGVKIVMVTALDDFDSVRTSFREQADGYLVKPVRKDRVEELLRNLELTPE